MTFDSKTSTFTRSGSFRQPSLTERLQESRDRAVGESYRLLFINFYFRNIYIIINAHTKMQFKKYDFMNIILRNSCYKC